MTTPQVKSKALQAHEERQESISRFREGLHRQANYIEQLRDVEAFLFALTSEGQEWPNQSLPSIDVEYRFRAYGHKAHIGMNAQLRQALTEAAKDERARLIQVLMAERETLSLE